MQIYIVSVGISDYGGQIAIPNLPCAACDASSVYRVLHTLYNASGKLLCSNESTACPADGSEPSEPHGCGARADILQALNAARRYLRPEDLFVFFFSGHGVADAPGYILPHAAEYGQPGSYLMHQTLFGTLATLPCMHIICFLNCCYAGTAVPAALPGMIVSKKRAALYVATDDKTVALGRLPGSRSGCSPFAQTLVDYLEHQTAAGASFNPEHLGLYLQEHGQADLQQEGRLIKVRPLFVSSLPAVGSGQFAFTIRRPGMCLEVSAVHYCATGETLRVPVHIEGAGLNTVQWTARSRLAGFQPLQMEFRDNALELGFQYPGDFDIEIVAENTSTQEKACRTLTIHVRPGESRPPIIEEQPLTLCGRGEAYSADLRIQGGVAPFLVVIHGLPEGLHYEQPNPGTIHIHGLVPSAGGGGTPLSGDNGPLVHMLDVHVKDGARGECHERRRLIVYHRADYCRVDTGTYCVGGANDAATIQAICKVIRLDMEHIAATRGVKINALQAMLDQAAAGVASQVLDGIIADAPYAQVQVRSYLIKKYPVTRHDWQRYLAATNAPHVPVGPWPPQTQDDLKKPVTSITYKALCDYLHWKCTRLPTGREWQVAADGGQGRLFPWGNEFDHTKCNMRGGPRSTDLSPVDAFDNKYVSTTGTRDMIGNAAEWVDRRVYWPSEHVFAQIFRGGSFRDTPLFGIISRDSQEVGVLFAMDEAAGQAGETRFDWLGFREVIDLDPTPAEGQGMVAIPASDVQINHDTPKHVSQFRMARYAVSNLEYWEFVRATGHRRPPDWKPLGDMLPFPHDQRHLPVVNVSYLDAHAFCLWKSRTQDGVYRLPTPEQWLAAVQGGECRRFPWGNDFNLQFCNEITSGWGKRVPVFDLPEGRSKHGVFNLVGNVYEWVGPLEVRGGSWHTDCQRLAPNGYRTEVENDGRALGFRQGDVGFRYVLLKSRSGQNLYAETVEKKCLA